MAPPDTARLAVFKDHPWMLGIIARPALLMDGFQPSFQCRGGYLKVELWFPLV
jgi:hypothetical protein